MTLSNLIPGVSEAKAIVGGVMVLGLVGLALWVMRVNHLRAQYHGYADDAVAALASAGFVKPKPDHIALDINALAKARDANAASLKQARAIIANDNAQSAARAKAYSDSKSQDAANNTENDKLEASTAGQRAALGAIAKVPGGSVPCKVPDALTANLKGL